jgi:uncharacterized protein YkwD
MPRLFRRLPAASAVLASLLLVSCGGGGDSAQPATGTGPSAAMQRLAQQAQAPTVTGDTAVDAFNWFNYRRWQAGLPTDVSWSPNIALAAQRHADYQRLNGTPSNPITHEEVSGKPGFSGIDVPARLNAAGYTLSSGGFAFGEVISYMGDPSGFVAAEELIAAIYHRFVIFEPRFRGAGAGAAKDSIGATILNVNFGSRNGLPAGLGSGNHIVYPVPGQVSVPTSFASDSESPDPVPNANIVGYPISIQANGTECITTTGFTVTPHAGGAALPTRLLSYATDAGVASDPHPTPLSGAAIIPLSPLAASTTYDVTFSGNISAIANTGSSCVGNGAPFTHSWSFTTQ